MGNPFLLQACLRLSEREIPKPLELGKEYHFKKEGHRLYQINVPMDLRTTDWKFLGRVIVKEYTVGNNMTKGIFILVKEFSDNEKEIITKTYVSDKDIEKVLKNKNFVLKINVKKQQVLNTKSLFHLLFVREKTSYYFSRIAMYA